MGDTVHHIELCEAILSLIERKRAETGNPTLGAGFERLAIDGQFCDIGDSYRAAIFYQGDAQKAEALASLQKLQRSGVLHAPIVTTIRPASTFWPAEEYHQQFWKKNPTRYHEYREGCGRDKRLAELWGAAAAKPLVH